VTKFCLWAGFPDLITYATFDDDRLRGLGVPRWLASSSLGNSHYRASVIYFSEACAEIRPFDRFWHNNGSKCAESCIWPIFTSKMSNFGPKKWQFQACQNTETWNSKYIRNY